MFFKVVVDYCMVVVVVMGMVVMEVVKAAAAALLVSGCLKAISGVVTELRMVMFILVV